MAYQSNTTNVVPFPRESPRKSVVTFVCGSKITIEVSENEPPLTVAQTIYLLSNVQYQIHRMMEP